ncbi:MAG: DNA polymerase III subunit delta [Saprospirales bacterium]|nr:MAG: DNA polymerase III subunit delta [Saprospirales bacterium]
MSQSFKRVYLLHGEESFLINRELERIEKGVIQPGFEEFNKFTYFGLDAKGVRILDQVTTRPMIGDPQLVILKNAHQFKDWEPLLSYVKKPVDFTILVIAHPEKKFDGRTAFYKQVQKLEKEGLAEIFEAKKLYDNKIPEWIVSEVKNRGMRISMKAATLMTEYLGNNIEGIVKELDKLEINLEKGSKEFTIDLIEKYVGQSRKFGVFELTKALSMGDKDRASHIANIMSHDPKNNPIFMLNGALYSYFSRVYRVHSLRDKSDFNVAKTLKIGHAFFAKEYVSAARVFNKAKCERAFGILYEYDLRSKGIHYFQDDEESMFRNLVSDILELV